MAEGPALSRTQARAAVPVEQHPGSDGPGEHGVDLALFGVSKGKPGPDVR
jgi:hypothetical protein